jgi:hypothetical protein
MRNLSILTLCLLVLIAGVPSVATAQVKIARASFLSDNTSVQRAENDRDSLWSGMLIGAGVGAAVGMLIAPPAMCPGNDTECATIVRVVIGLPAIVGGLGVGALVDGLMSRSHRPGQTNRGAGVRPIGIRFTTSF